MAEKLRLEVVTRRRRLLDVEVDEVRVPGVLGEFGVLPSHTPLLSAVGIGPLTYRQGREEHVLAVRAGFVEVLADRVTVLADEAEAPGEIDVDAAKRAVAEAEAAMKSASGDELERLAADLRMAGTRLAVASRR